MLDLSKPSHAHVEERLRTDPMIWLSTVKPDGTAHLVPVWFLWDGEHIYIFSKPDQKIRNLKQNKSAFLGLDDTRGGDEPIMIAGEAELLPQGSVTPAMPAYEEKYARQLAQYKWTGESMGQEYTEPIRIKPSRFIFFGQ
jgi:PPOX class probable F420-dependent enzyme